MIMIVKVLIGILIILSPVIITGSWYNTSTTMGALLVAELVMRILAFVIGLLVIYDTIKNKSE